MWKIIVGFIIFTGLALYLLNKGGATLIWEAKSMAVLTQRVQFVLLHGVSTVWKAREKTLVSSR